MVWQQHGETLINPNQCQAFGIPICDEPTYQHRPLVIEADFNNRIPISMVGYTSGFINRYPIYDNIETCQHITILNEQDQDPSKHIFNISSMEEDLRSNVFKLRSINQVRSQTSCAPPVTYIQDDMAIHDFDRTHGKCLNWVCSVSHGGKYNRQHKGLYN